MSDCVEIDGGITAALGFRASGLCAGIKEDSLDLALLVSDRPAVSAATFTTNKIQGPTVRLCRERLGVGGVSAVIINSGNANACVGPQGMIDARRMGKVTADDLDLEEQNVMVCSTGVIGVPMPMPCVEMGIRLATTLLSKDGGSDAARAIMTTDTVDKQVARQIQVDGKTITIGGMSKGAGMIEPNMATMLAFVTTDAVVDRAALQRSLSRSVQSSFNRISVDGDQSCNDTVLLLANGAAGNQILDEQHRDWGVFCSTLEEVTLELAQKIVLDGEGATKFVTVGIRGAASAEDATRAVRQVANSLLVKTSWFGQDPNWGRVIDAVGHSGVELREELIDITYDDVMAVKGGMAAPGDPLAALEEVLKRDRFSVTVDLHIGDFSDTVYTCDCSLEYVRINSEYTS